MNQNFSINLRLLCSEHPSIARVCREIGINRQQFNRYINGIGMPSAHNLFRISRFFNVPEKDMLIDSDVFRIMRLSQVGSISSVDPIRILSNAFSSQVESLRRYMGFYYTYYLTPSWPDSIMCSMLWLREERGFVVSHTYERAIDSTENIRQTVRYSGLASYHGENIYLIEKAFSDDGFLSESIIYPSHRQQVKYLHGLTIGVSARPRLVPYSSPIIWNRIPEHVSAKEALEKTGIYPIDSPKVDNMIRTHLKSGSTKN